MSRDPLMRFISSAHNTELGEVRIPSTRRNVGILGIRSKVFCVSLAPWGWAGHSNESSTVAQRWDSLYQNILKLSYGLSL